MLIEAKDIWKAAGGSPILRGVSLGVARGQTLAVVGPSGAGKSTLLRCLNYLAPFDRGEATIDGLRLTPGLAKDRAQAVVRAVRRSLGMVFQDFNLFPHLTALENVALGPRRVLGLSAGDARERAGRLLARVHLSEKVASYPGELSGGQKQRVAVARALAMQPKALLLDEPTSALDPHLKEEVVRVIEELRAEGMTMVLVTHEYALARRVADRVALLVAGKVEREGPPGEVLGAG